jgi:hypothetical protein
LPRLLWLGQGDHSTPELLRVSNFDVVFPCESERAFLGDAKHGHSRRHGHSVAAQHRHNAGGDEKTPARIDTESAQLHAASVDALNRLWFTAVLIERVDDEVIFPALRNLSAAFSRRKGPVGQVDEFAIGMDMDRPGALACWRLKLDKVSLMKIGSRDNPVASFSS